MGTRVEDEYQWLTYSEVAEKVHVVGRGIVSVLESTTVEQACTKVGVFAKNCTEWILALHGSYSQSLVNVAVYDTFSDNALVHVINHSNMKLLFVSEALFPKLLSHANKFVSLRLLVLLDGEPTREQTEALPETFNLFSFNQILRRGERSRAEVVPPRPDDLATIMYTSGTTGIPKGVLLTHGNLIAGQAGALLRIQPADGSWLNEDNVYISFLPLAHSFERVAMCCLFTVGGAVGFSSGDPKRLVSDIGVLRPTIMVGVPRVFDKVYAAVMDKVSQEGFLKRALFHISYYFQAASINWWGRSHLLDSLVFDKIRAKLGGRLERIITGGAPLTVRTYNFIRVCFCSEVYQGYGLTETAAASFVSFPSDSDLSIGPPCSTVEVMLVPVDGMPEYGKEGMSGELWIRGPTVFQGYFRDPKKTEDDLHPDGWFMTGDIGQWTPQGTMKIVDRKKNIFKLAQGEYVAAEVLESTYSESPFISQIFVHGDSTHSFLIAIVFVHEPGAVEWAKQHGFGNATLEQLCDSKDFNGAVVADLNRVHALNGLKGFERILGVILYWEEFNTLNDLATPTTKLRRPQLQRFFKPQIATLTEQIQNK